MTDKPMLLKIDPTSAIKAVGDWELEVLGVPFGGPDNGRDADGQYFSPKTRTYHETYKEIPAYYYHGINPDRRSEQEVPELIGMAKYERTDEQGHWYRVALNKLSNFAKRIWEAAKQGIARASSGSLNHLVRIGQGGEITHWPVAELSLIDATEGRAPANAYAVALPVMKASYKAAGLDLQIPSDEGEDTTPAKPADEAEADEAQSDGVEAAVKTKQGEFEMEKEELTKILDEREAAKAAEAEAKAKAAAEQEAEIAKRVEEALKAKKEEDVASRRLPFKDGAPAVAKHADTWKYDGLDAADTAIVMGVLKGAGKSTSAAAAKALAFKLEEDKGEVGHYGQRAMKAAGIKANEIDYSTYATYGDEWVGVAYSTALWEAIRLGTFVVGKLPQIEVPQGMESIALPLESTDPTWYKVAQATAIESTLKIPQATVTNSPLSTGQVSLTLAKLGARVIWTGEMDEDSLIPFASQLRQQLAVSGAEYLESAVIDGDTETGASTNINDIDGTPAATDWFMVWNGFRKSCLVTTTANSRAGGALTVEDYIETAKLMGSAGKNAIDPRKVGFIVDPATYYKTMQLPEVLTRDVFVSPTLEGGRITGLWGYELGVSGNICKNGGAGGLSESTGKCDETASDNTYGQILAVRWDQWKFGWRRRMTIETTRIANADSTEIVALMRCGLIQRDTEASAITYGITV